MKTKKAYLMILMIALSLLNAYSQLPSYVPSNGLVGYWPFNGNANDESGNGNNGTVNGATLTTDRNGISNKAYSFDGVNDYIQTNYFGVFGTGSRSISFWAKTSGINGLNNDNMNVICYGSPGNGATYEVALNHSCEGLSLDINNGVNTKSAITSDNTWHFFTIVYNNDVGNNFNAVSYYYNSTLLSSNCLAGNLQTINTNNINPVVFGAYWNKLARFFQGSIDDITIYNRSLTQQEITKLYNSCNTPTAIITPETNTTFCQGGSVNLNVSTGTNYMYQWYNNGNTINNATSSIYNATISGNYTVKVTDGACNATSSTQTVTVNGNPSVSLNALNNVVFKTSLPIQLVGNPSGGIYSGDAISGNIFTPSNATLGKKTISYNYTTQQGCSGSASQTTIVTDSVGNVCSTYDTLKIKVKFTAGLYANTINTIKFYPNPTKDVLFIDNGNYQAMSGYSIKIVSLAGTVIYNQPITSQQVQISMNKFATKGLYIAQIVDSNNAIVDSKKIVLE